MLAHHSRHSSTVRLPVESKKSHSSKSESSRDYKKLPKLKTSIETQGMLPHERLPGVSQLLTPISPPPYGRDQPFRHSSHRSTDLGKKPAQHRSSLPLEDILCPPEHLPSVHSRAYITPPPLTSGSSHSQSPFFSPGSQYSLPTRVSPPRTLPPARSNSFASNSSGHHYSHSSHYSTDHYSNDYYQHLPQKPSSRGSAETSLTSGSSGSIPPPTQVRLLGEQIFPGEGVCWIYSDGSHVRKEIDGEAVNPQWGVTKAGKPRKRLAQACLTCREKKIKCDLADPKCLQCDKSGRECRYASARASRRLDR